MLNAFSVVSSDNVIKMSLRTRVTSAGEPLHDADITTDEDTDKTSKVDDVNIFGKKINKVIFMVHLNICLYAASFFIQVGTLPVSGTDKYTGYN